jgi:hypothetical protein
LAGTVPGVGDATRSLNLAYESGISVASLGALAIDAAFPAAWGRAPTGRLPGLGPPNQQGDDTSVPDDLLTTTAPLNGAVAYLR